MLIPFAISRQAEALPASIEPPPFRLPLYGSLVAAGFPSPAEDHVEQELDANELLVRNKAATYFVRVQGQSMRGVWVRNGDIAVVDASLEPRSGSIVVAVLDGEMLIKQLGFTPEGQVLLIPANANYPTITVKPEQDFYIWGVVTWTLHQQLDQRTSP